MLEITYPSLFISTSILWILVRWGVAFRSKSLCWRRELELMLVYICIVVVVRFTFFPFFKENGTIPPMRFDPNQAFPPRLNFEPIVHLFDYPTSREALLNLIGNTAMFIPLGIIWPWVFRGLDTHTKVLAAGFGVSLCIEILQLPLYERVSDVDDLILNTLGYAVGYGILLLVSAVSGYIRKRKT